MAGLSAPALFELFSTGEYSDFTIICKGREFKVHKTIICPESDFFRAVAKGNFQEQGSVELKESDPEIVVKVLHYLYFSHYHTNYEICTSEEHLTHHTTPLFDSNTDHMRFHAIERNHGPDEAGLVQARFLTNFQVFMAADMLGVESLKRAAIYSLFEIIRKSADAAALEFILNTIYAELTGTGNILRSAMTSACAVNCDRLRDHANVVAVLQTHEPAVWHAAEFMTRVTTRRMQTYIVGAVGHATQERVYINSNNAEFNGECSRCGEGIWFEIVEAFGI